MLTLLKVGADVKLSKEQAQHLDDLIEQQQKRIAELVDALDHIARVANSSRTQSRRDRWICLRANCAISSSDEWRTADLPKIIENSRGRELRLREASFQVEAAHTQNAFNKAVGVMQSIIEEAPQQNLNAVRREAYADGYYQGFCDAWGSNFDWEQDHVHYGLKQSEIRAEQEYPSVKDGE